MTGYQQQSKHLNHVSTFLDSYFICPRGYLIENTCTFYSKTPLEKKRLKIFFTYMNRKIIFKEC
jgi:hypothetical protein